MESIGQKLKALRVKKRMSQLDLALRSGLSSNFIGLVERDAQNPSITSFIKLGEALEISVVEYCVEMFGEKDPYKNMVLNEECCAYSVGYYNRNALTTEIISCFKNMGNRELYMILDLVKAVVRNSDFL